MLAVILVLSACMVVANVVSFVKERRRHRRYMAESLERSARMGAALDALERATHGYVPPSTGT